MISVDYLDFINSFHFLIKMIMHHSREMKNLLFNFTDAEGSAHFAYYLFDMKYCAAVTSNQCFVKNW